MNLFDFKEVLNDRFFEIHNKSFEIISQIFFFDLNLYAQGIGKFNSLNRAMKRKKKWKNKLRVIGEMRQLNEGLNKVNIKLNKMVNIYEKVLKKYHKEGIEYSTELDQLKNKLKNNQHENKQPKTEEPKTEEEVKKNEKGI
jgi:hypothetical protein